MDTYTDRLVERSIHTYIHAYALMHAYICIHTYIHTYIIRYIERHTNTCRCDTLFLSLYLNLPHLLLLFVLLLLYQECGILTEGGLSLEGPAFRKLSPAQLDSILPTLQVLARSSPDDKYMLVCRLNGRSLPDSEESWLAVHPGCKWADRDLILPGYLEEWQAARSAFGTVQSTPFLSFHFIYHMFLYHIIPTYIHTYVHTCVHT